AKLLEGALRPHRGWIATYLSFWVQAYNTRLVRKDELPRRYEDLLDARWKGKLGIEARVPDWYAALVTDMGEEKGIRFFRELVAKNGISVRGGHTLLNNLVVAGDVPLALTMYQYIVEGVKRKGAPVDWIVLEPAIGRMSGVGVARAAAHPHAALLFYDFMLSQAAQAQSLPELALSAGPDREQRLVEGAKKEGALLFYTTFPPEYANQLIEPYERRYGVKVNYWRARSEIILNRALAEGRAGSAT